MRLTLHKDDNGINMTLVQDIKTRDKMTAQIYVLQVIYQVLQVHDPGHAKSILAALSALCPHTHSGTTDRISHIESSDFATSELFLCKFHILL